MFNSLRLFSLHFYSFVDIPSHTAETSSRKLGSFLQLFEFLLNSESYKTVGTAFINFISWCFFVVFCSRSLVCSTNAVSYTHLDVYKRQV